MSEKKKICVITCAYNERGCIQELAQRLFKVFDSMPSYEFEVIAIENGSGDGTLEEMQRVRQQDSRFHIIQLARNFGLQGGLAAGLDAVDGDAAVLMAADLEDPPEVIREMVVKWEEGYLNVYGVVTNRLGTPALRRLNSSMFYWIIGKVSEHPLPAHARDFRLLDRKVYEQVRRIEDPHPMHRGLAAWTGFPSTGVEFVQEPRFAGETKASSRQVSEFAIRSIFSQSMTPLRIMPVIGLLLVGGSFAALVGLTINTILNGVPFPGFGTLLAVVILMFGIVFCFLSVIGIYVGLMFEQVRHRPHYIINEEWPPRPSITPSD